MHRLNTPSALSHEELELAACSLVGQIIFALSRLETNLALYLRDHKGQEQSKKVLLRLENSVFKVKLDMLQGAVQQFYGSNETCLKSFGQWIQDAHAIRTTRNDLVHGRWGVSASAQQVINVIGLPGSPNQQERRYSLPELAESLDRVKNLSKDLSGLTEKWPF